MIKLLDANVLIALGDCHHSHHAPALAFFRDEVVGSAWATCPITENAFVRILGDPRYPNGPGTSLDARKMLLSITANPGHQFWSDDISLMDIRAFPNIPTAKSLTDFYLLALAMKHGGQLATFDQGMDAAMIIGGARALRLLKE